MRGQERSRISTDGSKHGNESEIMAGRWKRKWTKERWIMAQGSNSRSEIKKNEAWEGREVWRRRPPGKSLRGIVKVRVQRKG